MQYKFCAKKLHIVHRKTRQPNSFKTGKDLADLLNSEKTSLPWERYEPGRFSSPGCRTGFARLLAGRSIDALSDRERIAFYRQLALEALQRAKNSANGEQAIAYLDIATRWTTIADDVEQWIARHTGLEALVAEPATVIAMKSGTGRRQRRA